MRETNLTISQSLSAARIFLNTFGLILEDNDDINTFSKIKIFDKNMNEVGVLCFNGNKVLISANYNNSIFEVNYEIPKVFCLVDTECNSTEYSLFGEWSNKIKFEITNINNAKIDGEFLITCSVDSELGVNCVCHPLINCEIPNTGSFTLKILRDGLTFGLEIKTNDSNERIDIRPFDQFNGFYIHDIKKRNLDEKNYPYIYRRFSGIFNGSETGKNKDNLQMFLKEEKDRKIINYYSKFIQKVDKENSINAIIQKGMLMKELGSLVFERIKELRTILLIDEISILDNLISVCFDNYTDDEIEALLDLRREKMDYQDKANCLISSYYGIGNKSSFLSPTVQRKLIKNSKDI